ncbi:MAG: hypothetical protein IPJ06_16785 [Saprospiraceae bacterium]|nr:hypothetical protein [Saprospiraceae bacterium]
MSRGEDFLSFSVLHASIDYGEIPNITYLALFIPPACPLPQQHISPGFEKEVLAKLNPDQRQAVYPIKGPVMAIATGDGEDPAAGCPYGNNPARLTDTDPREILCPAYTEAGALAMRKRLIEFIGPESA